MLEINFTKIFDQEHCDEHRHEMMTYYILQGSPGDILSCTAIAYFNLIQQTTFNCTFTSNNLIL